MAFPVVPVDPLRVRERNMSDTPSPTAGEEENGWIKRDPLMDLALLCQQAVCGRVPSVTKRAGSPSSFPFKQVWGFIQGKLWVISYCQFYVFAFRGLLH